MWVWHFTPAWADPEATAKLHWVEVIHPFAFPVLVFHLLDFVRKTFREHVAGFDLLQDQRGIHIRFVQCDDIGIAP
ncbi:Uncharacterised protein [Vibrio cholerae]|uniref:Uncharacterized protein n=1 Tax=Vibrio cholerae TaxID=666 RepID=A0A656AS07_VIBCL|nr:Uncharacterised protein [Vibrio cholerae]CSD30961.1 Uncharacterised protein [Vibrio cholerae]